MDYTFFVRRVAAISEAALDNALVWAKATVASPHDGFRHQIVSQIKPVPDYVLSPILQQLEHLLPAKAVTGAEVILLKSGESVGEHSDLQGIKENHMWNAAFHHKIQVPLQTNPQCWSWHRRTKKVESSVRHLRRGYAWAYNDYVWHGGVNQGQEDRYQLSISYLDPEMQWVPNLVQMED